MAIERVGEQQGRIKSDVHAPSLAWWIFSEQAITGDENNMLCVGVEK